MRPEVEIPKESFRILIAGKYKERESFQRMNDSVFNLNRKEMVEFKTHLDESKESPNCKTLSESSHWSILSARRGPGSAVVMCTEYREANDSKWSSMLSFHIPVNSNGSELQNRLYSADYKKLTKQDCDQAQAIFNRYPKVLKGTANHQLTWSFSCDGGPSEFMGVIEALVK